MKFGSSQFLNAILLCALLTVLVTQQFSIHQKSQIENLRREATNAPIIIERIVEKEIMITPPKPKLHPNWPELVLGATNGITFKRLEVKVPDLSVVVKFWYPVEETLHSASYILQQEAMEVIWWIRTIHETQTSQKNCNVLDVGSNGGFFSLLSRSLNCNVLGVDAQPWCLTRLSSGAAINGFDDKISTRWTAVSDNPDLTIDVGATKCSGLWAVKNSEWINEESSKTVQVKSSTCTAIVNDWLPDQQEIINLMKIDAEGSEVAIIRSALPLVKAHRIEHILAEFVPGRTKEITPFPIVQDTFNQLYAAGYVCFKQVNGGHVTIEVIHHYFDPANTEKGRNTPHMWRCSLLKR
jgi:FkbM family methyltransferase